MDRSLEVSNHAHRGIDRLGTILELGSHDKNQQSKVGRGNYKAPKQIARLQSQPVDLLSTGHCDVGDQSATIIQDSFISSNNTYAIVHGKPLNKMFKLQSEMMPLLPMKKNDLIM